MGLRKSTEIGPEDRRQAKTPTRTTTPTATPPTQHTWLLRPVEPNAVDTTVARFYPYGSRAEGTLPIHHGVEFVNPTGTLLLAAADGTVVVAGDDTSEVYGARTDFYGLLVIVRLDRDYYGESVFTLYGHLSEIAVEVGQEVRAGQPLGRVGMTGVAMGPHLHFEVRVGENSYSNTRNPELWLRPLQGRGVFAGRLIDSQGSFVPEALITVHQASAPDERWQDLTSYPAQEVNSDRDWQENFVMGDVPAGHYVLRTHIGERYYTADVQVEEGKTALVTIRTAD